MDAMHFWLHFLPSGPFFGSTSPKAFFRPNHNSGTPTRGGAVKVGRRADLATHSMFPGRTLVAPSTAAGLCDWAEEPASIVPQRGDIVEIVSLPAVMSSCGQGRRLFDDAGGLSLTAASTTASLMFTEG
jgi:hypothetical protein